MLNNLTILLRIPNICNHLKYDHLNKYDLTTNPTRTNTRKNHSADEDPSLSLLDIITIIIIMTAMILEIEVEIEVEIAVEIAVEIGL
jgi:hypothetical protein